MNLNDTITSLKGIGEKNEKLFHKLSIFTIHDLISYYPRDYVKLENEIAISDISVQAIVSIKVQLLGQFQTMKIKGLTISNAYFQDKTGKIKVTFFNMPYIQKSFSTDTCYILHGLVKTDKNNSLIMEQPKIYGLEEYEEKKQRLQPVYVLTKGLTNHMLQKMIKQALSDIVLDDFLPTEVIENHSLLSLNDAMLKIHMPYYQNDIAEARKRIVFQEFFIFMLSVRKNKERIHGLKNENKMFETADSVRLLEKLPYTLTNAQKRVWTEIKNDLGSSYCMNRLIQGDVGSGKTILAILALLMCVGNGYQGAMMAPTEVLARQHYESIVSLSSKFHLPFKPALLTGALTQKNKKDAYRKIEQGEANVVIGTHALIQEKVHYKNLALVITDEQHRFGVRQREALAGKGDSVHVLVMSATPIPRTLAIMLYGDLNISIVDELPANRLPIKNCVVNTDYRKSAYAFIEKEVEKGNQIYIICPMVEEGELEDVENVIDYAEKLKAIFPSNIQIGILHGKMKPLEKNKIMEAYANHNIDILVSTTVIEVGINVPNATVMMVENAERFGLAQLHQLRGRVGRGNKQSYCIFVSSKTNKETMKRLSILNFSNDGFHIAEEDMKLRGPGDIFGIRQSGDLEFKMADIYRDAMLLKEASTSIDNLLDDNPDFFSNKNVFCEKDLLENRIQQVDFRSI